MKIVVFGFLAVLGFAALVLFLSTASKATARHEIAPAPSVQIGPGPLKVDGFWALIDHSAAFEDDPEAQLADLRASLNRLTPDQIAEFEKLFDDTMRNSYSWDLWGAAYVANGGASDDGFEYFRCWLISKGRRVFDAVSADPDSLAGLLAIGAGGDLEFEEFAYVARDVWAAKTGRDWNEMPHIADMAYDSQPKGVPFTEDNEVLARRYPELWRRFGR